MLSVLYTSDLLGQQKFYAYHTKVVHTSTDYFGKYADLIVVLGDGRQLEFTRRTQYLPKWVTPQGSFMIDDFFPGRDSDHEFKYNYVRLMEQSDERIVVHWRYIPDTEKIKQADAVLDPTFIEGFTAAVHELFIIYPNGKIEREVKDARGSFYENWQSPNYADKQTLQLKLDGIEHSNVNWGDKSISLPLPITKNPIIKRQGLVPPVLAWTFDEGSRDYPEELKEDIEGMLQWEPQEVIGKAIENINHSFHTIRGHGALYKKGVSGTALGFDGFYTGVEVPRLSAEFGTTYYREDGVPEFKDALTVEVWLALDAYPYNVAPIVHQSENFGAKGFYFGIDAFGHMLFTINGQTVKSEQPIELYRWTHVVGAFGNGQLELFVDGKSVATQKASGEVGKQDVDLMIGLNTEKENCTDFVRSPMQNIPFVYGIQGLLDEVKIYNKTLSKDQINKYYQVFRPSDLTSPLKKAVLPGEVGVANEFGAFYKNLKHHELWDKMWRLSGQTDIVVKFDNNPASVVYWRGTNFAANWVTDNNRWMADQSSEIFTKHGCSEHMADKQTRHSYARIIENNDARVVIHWRYPNVDVGYICTDKRNWSDEYHTIYPDGTAIRKVVYNNARAPGFQDIQFFTNPGETALDVVHLNAMTVANLKGETLELIWENPNNNPEQKMEDATIEWLNSKSDWKVFTVFQGPGISTWGRNEQSKYTDDPFAGPWNHWPVSLVPSDGRYALGHDRVTHFALGANDAAPEYGSMVHYGFTNQNIDKVIPKARFWQRPPKISSLKGAKTAVFKKEEKAYFLEGHGSEKISFLIHATKDSPLINPAFVISNMDSLRVKLNEKLLSRGKDLRIGKSYDTNGKELTIVWLRTESEKTVKVEFAP